eukprot:456375-Amphidinium_carterae.1
MPARVRNPRPCASSSLSQAPQEIKKRMTSVAPARVHLCAPSTNDCKNTTPIFSAMGLKPLRT